MPEYVTLGEYARFENRVLTSIREVREDVAATKTLVLNVQAGLQAHIDTVALELNTKIDALRNELKGEMQDLRAEVRANAQFTNAALTAICAHLGIMLPRQ